MKISIALLQLIVSANVSSAFSPAALPRGGIVTVEERCSTTRIFSQWEDEEEEIVIDRKSFAEAGEGLKKEDDDAKMDGMGDYDANPSVSFYVTNIRCCCCFLRM